MPRYDKTGPLGKGPMTGRGLGKCSDIKDVNVISDESESISEKIIKKIL